MNEKIEELKEMREDLRIQVEVLEKEFEKYFERQGFEVGILEIVDSDLPGDEKDLAILMKQQYVSACSKIAVLNKIL